MNVGFSNCLCILSYFTLAQASIIQYDCTGIHPTHTESTYFILYYTKWYITLVVFSFTFQLVAHWWILIIFLPHSNLYNFAFLNAESALMQMGRWVSHILEDTLRGRCYQFILSALELLWKGPKYYYFHFIKQENDTKIARGHLQTSERTWIKFGPSGSPNWVHSAELFLEGENTSNEA